MVWQSNYLKMFFIVYSVLIAAINANQYQNHPLHRTIKIQNDANAMIEISWIHPESGQVISMGESITQGDVISFDTFVNHTFAIQKRQLSTENVSSPAATVGGDATEQEVPTSNIYTSMYDGESSSPTYVTVASDEDEQFIVIHDDLQLERLHGLPKPMRNTTLKKINQKKHQSSDKEVNVMMDWCQEYAKKHATDTLHLQHLIVSCFEQKTAAMFEVVNEELAYQRELRRTIASMNENYTCADTSKTTTQPFKTTTWTYNDNANDKRSIAHTRNVGILHSHRASQIHIIHDFISDEECMAIQAAAEPILHRGTVADGKGGSTMSQNRKAWQAGINVKDVNDTKNHIANVKRRLFAYTNHAVGYNMTLDGQEDIMSIQYFGLNSTSKRADNSNDVLVSPDQYTPHCDGDCSDSIHKTGSRVATMVMYCEVPIVGGGTNFQQANVFVKPTKGAAAFFSYMDPQTFIHDEGFTTHSGCPVLVGTKRIAVQWMRIGVDQENPWDSFDTNNVKIVS